MNAHLILSTDFGTKAMGAQLGPYFYLDANGKQRRHFFDAERIGTSGEWCLFAVKSVLSSKHAPLIEILRALHEHDERLAEATLCIVDEDCLKPWQIQRAKIVFEARRFVDEPAETAILALLGSADRELTVLEIDTATGLENRTVDAVARLFWKRRVTLRNGDFLDYAARVRAA